MRLTALLAELQQIDRALAGGDLEALQALVPRRAEVIAAVAAELRQQPPLPSYATLLRSSLEAGMAAQRSILIARHQVAQQMAELAQRQRLSSDLAQQHMPQGTRLDFSA